LSVITAWIFFNKYKVTRIISRAKEVSLNKTAVDKLLFRQNMINLYLYYQKLLKYSGFPSTYYETPFEFYNRIKRDPLFEKIDISMMFELFVRSRFSKDDLTTDDLKLMINIHAELTKVAMLKLGKFKYYTYRYLLGLF
jgi:hypothetical protein